jgi:hypothetical protein
VIIFTSRKRFTNFSTHGLKNEKWTVYEASKGINNNHDYGIIVNFRDILISPEQIKEKNFIKKSKLKMALKSCNFQWCCRKR